MTTKTVEKDTKDVPFHKFLGRDIGLLRIAGLYSMKNVFTGENKKRTSNWEGVPFAIGIFHILFAACCEFRTITRVWSVDPNYAIEVFTPMLSAILIAVKGIRLWFWRQELNELLRALAVMWEQSHLKVKIRKKILQSAERTRLVGKYYGAMIIILVANYAVTPYIQLLQHYLYKNATSEPYDYSITVYPTTYPFSTDTMTRYIICITWEQFIFIFFVLYWIAADGLFAQLTTHTAIQYRILCHDLKSIATSDAAAWNENERLRQIAMISQRHHELYRFCQKIKNIFNPIMFLMMLLTGMNMCLCAFRLDKEVSEGNWSGVIKYIVHAITLIIQAVIYCGYADTLTQQSGLMARAAYDCQWIERSKQFKIMLIIIMMRSQKEFKCTAYGIFAVNLRQITAIVNTAASYFTLLKSMT